ncbi:GSCOCG00012745001-RA-CDS, partial [Cotesia congregata]
CNIHLTDANQARLMSVLDAEFNLMDQADLGTLKGVEYEIELNDYTPIHVKPYRRSPRVTAALHKITEQLLDQGIIQASNSEWSFQPVMVQKKLLPGQDPDDIKSWRMCIDYRPLNKIMKMVNYPMRRIDTLLEVIREGAYRSVIDCTNAYYQIPIKPEHRQYTAFAVEGMGSFEFIRMPFGLSTAPGTFQRKMDLLIQMMKRTLRQRNLPVHWINFVHPYMDDWVVATPTFDIHLEVLGILFQIFREVGLLIKREKCKFCVPEMKYLGFIIKGNELHPDPDKLTAIKDYPEPASKKQLRRF